MNGWVTIGTKLDTKQLEKDIKTAESQLKQYEREGEKLSTQKAKLEVDLQEYEKAKAEIQEMTDKTLQQAQTSEQVNFVLEAEETQLAKLKEQYSTQFGQISSINEKLQSNQKNQQAISSQLERQKQQLAQANEELRRTQTLNNVFQGINSTMNRVVKNVLRWGLALFSIRGITGMIRSTMSTLSSENTQIATDIEYMRWILAQTLKPVVEWIINALYTVIAIINLITRALFHYDFLAGASAKKFKSMKVSSGGIAKNMAEARKQLAGFDEMNVLDDNVKSAGGGGAGGGVGGSDWIPPDLTTRMDEVKKKFDEFKSDWQSFGPDMERALYKMPFSVWTGAFGDWDLAVYGVVQVFYGLWNVVEGTIGIVKGVIDIIKGIIRGDTELIKKGVIEVVKGIIQVIWGIINVVSGVSNTVIGVILGVCRTIYKLWQEYVVNNIINLVNTKLIPGVTGAWTTIRDRIKNTIKTIQNFLTTHFGEIGTKIGNVLGKSIAGVVNSILTLVERKINGFFLSINTAISAINNIPGVEIKKLSYVHFPRLAKGGIVNMPGRGVMVGSAIAGERGAEGVIPLTDSQQMALLGEAIGRYITINANITNTMNGRVISRELKTIQNEDDFAYNR